MLIERLTIYPDGNADPVGDVVQWSRMGWRALQTTTPPVRAA